MGDVSVPMVSLDPVLAKRLETIVRRLHQLEGERDQLILQAREAGASLREIADKAGMSHVGIKKLIGRILRADERGA